MGVRIESWRVVAPALAGLAFAAAVAAWGAALDGYSQALHPVGLLGATGVPSAMAFNLVAFVVPGLLAASVAWACRTSAPAGAGAGRRFGLQLLLVSALAFTAQGLLPLDPLDLDARASRLHAVAWMAWWIAAVAAATCLGVGARRTRLTAMGYLAVGLVIAWLVLAAGRLVGAGAAQRLAYALWFTWLFAMAWRPARAGRRLEP